MFFNLQVLCCAKTCAIGCSMSKRSAKSRAIKNGRSMEAKMLAKTNQYIEDAVTTVRQLTQEEKIRQQCEAREDYYRRTAGWEKGLRFLVFWMDFKRI